MSPPDTPSRQLIICCDGTNNTLTGGDHDTNVLQLVSVLDPDRNDQLLYYDPGVGAPDKMPPTGIWDRLGRKWDRVQGLASGKGIYENIGGAYQFLIENHRRGDEIFLFGFSRGAFTARCVAGMVNLFGIVRKESAALIPTLISVYFSNTKSRADKRNRFRVANQLRSQFTSADKQLERVHFVGVWDTVSSVGLPYILETKITSDGFVKDKKMRHVRQALSLDEHRATFEPRLYWEENGQIAGTDQTVEQRWFRGAHSDVGGGYPLSKKGNQMHLSDQTFLWMLSEAKKCRLRINEAAFAAKTAAIQPPSAAAPPLVHDECYATPYWGVAGLVVREFVLPTEAHRQIRPAPEGVADTCVPVAVQWSLAKRWHIAIAFALLALLTAAIAGLFGYEALHGEMPWRAVSPQMLLNGGVDFNHWQRTLYLTGEIPLWSVPALPPDFHAGYAVAAILADFAFIASYSWWLGLLSAWAFYRLVGLRQVGAPKPWVARLKLGWLPCIGVAGDLAENVLTLITLALIGNNVIALSSWFAFLLAVANGIKWTGLLLSVPMIGAAVLKVVTRGAPPHVTEHHQPTK